MKAFVFAVILIASVFATELRQPQGIETIRKLEQNAYGQEILRTIQIQLTAGDPADDLIHMLQDEEEKLQKEQDKEDKAILKLQNQCIIDLKQLKTEIAEARKKIQQLTDLIKQLTPILEGKRTEKKQSIDRRDKIKVKLEQMKTARKEKEDEWKKEKSEHDRLTAVIQTGKTILQSVLNPSSFLETKAGTHAQALVQLANHFDQAKHEHYRHKSITSIFRILAQTAKNAPKHTSEKVTDKIFKIINKLLDKISQSRAIEKKDFDRWMKEYMSTWKGLTKKLNEEIRRIQQLTIDISVISKRLAISAKELKEQKVRLQEKIEQHDAREKECDAAGAKYAKDREARDNQREIISDAIGLLVTKIRLLKRYVGQRVKSLKKPFDFF